MYFHLLIMSPSLGPWVLNFPPCRGPGGSIPTGDVAGVVGSNVSFGKSEEIPPRLLWVATRKPERRILEINGHAGISRCLNTSLWPLMRCRRVSVVGSTRTSGWSCQALGNHFSSLLCIALISTMCP